MKNIKILMLFLGLASFSSELFAESNVIGSSKIVYGSEEQDSIITQKDINVLIKKGNDKTIISLVWVLYNILDDNEEILLEFAKLTTNSKKK